jgi:hypothetical protein
MHNAKAIIFLNMLPFLFFAFRAVPPPFMGSQNPPTTAYAHPAGERAAAQFFHVFKYFASNLAGNRTPLVGGRLSKATTPPGRAIW